MTDFFQTWYDDRDYNTQNFDAILNDLDLHVCHSCVRKQTHLCLFFDPYEYHMDLFNESCLSVRPASRPSTLHGTAFNLGHHTQVVQPNCFIPALLTGTIDFYHFTPLSVTLTMLGGHKVSTKQDLLASFFFSSHTFLCDQDENSV